MHIDFLEHGQLVKVGVPWRSIQMNAKVTDPCVCMYACRRCNTEGVTWGGKDGGLVKNDGVGIDG
jgi:hypothetical protein